MTARVSIDDYFSLKVVVALGAIEAFRLQTASLETDVRTRRGTDHCGRVFR